MPIARTVCMGERRAATIANKKRTITFCTNDTIDCKMKETTKQQSSNCGAAAMSFVHHQTAADRSCVWVLRMEFFAIELLYAFR